METSKLSCATPQTKKIWKETQRMWFEELGIWWLPWKVSVESEIFIFNTMANLVPYKKCIADKGDISLS